MARKDTKESHSLLEEIIGMLVVAVSLFYFVTLFTHNPSDPSLNSYSTDGKEVGNLGGIVGAYLSDISLQVFGSASFIIPLITTVIGISLLLKKNINIKQIRKLTGLVMLLISTAILLSLFKLSGLGFTKGGGFAGDLIASTLSQYINYAGAYLFATLGITLSFMLSTGISIVHVTAGSIKIFLALAQKILRTTKDILSKYIERHKRIRETRQQIKKAKSF